MDRGDISAPEARLKAEIRLNRDFASLDEQALLAFVRTQQVLEREGERLFSLHGLSDAQFNVLMILHDHRRSPLTLTGLSERLVVNAASAGALVDRMVGKGLVSRRADPGDRRAVRLALTAEGARLLERVRKPYYDLVPKVFGRLKPAEKRRLVGLLERMRDALAGIGRVQ